MKPIPNAYNHLKMRGVSHATIVEVLEGEGTRKNPMAIVRYVYDKQGNFLGYVENDQFTRDYLTGNV